VQIEAVGAKFLALRAKELCKEKAKAFSRLHYRFSTNRDVLLSGRNAMQAIPGKSGIAKEFFSKAKELPPSLRDDSRDSARLWGFEAKKEAQQLQAWPATAKELEAPLQAPNVWPSSQSNVTKRS
jgi:hypothetical protein